LTGQVLMAGGCSHHLMGVPRYGFRETPGCGGLTTFAVRCDDLRVNPNRNEEP
jgi:hypothetical protein